MASRSEIPDLVDQITQDIRGIVRDEIALAKAEIKPAVKRVGIGAGWFSAAGYFLISATIVFWFTMAAGFTWMYAACTPLSGWASAFLGTLTAVIVLLIAAVLFVVLGKKSFSKVKAPEKAPAAMGEAVAAVKAGIAEGSRRVAAELDADS